MNFISLPVIAATLLAVAFHPTKSVTAAELIAYGAESCEVTRIFKKEIASDFAESPVSRSFPLRFVDIANGPAGVALTEPITSSPTFVFADQGVEIARFVGYPGREQFLRIVESAAYAFEKSKAGQR